MADNTNGTKAFNYRYDPSDYRTRQDGTDYTGNYFLEAEHLEAIYRDDDGDGEKLLAKYLRGVVVDEIVNGFEYSEAGESTNLTFHHDHLRSVVAITDHQGHTAWEGQYGPFGNILTEAGNINNRQKYTGREMDEDTGLYYYRARYYDPEVGRFFD